MNMAQVATILLLAVLAACQLIHAYCLLNEYATAPQTMKVSSCPEQRLCDSQRKYYFSKESIE